MKALYRRGQARMGLQQWSEAVRDLQQAQSLCPAGDAQAALITEKLAEARRHAPDTAPTVSDSAERAANGDSSEHTGNSAQASRAPMHPPPEATAQMLERMEHMSDAEFAQMSAASGMPGMSRDMAKQAWRSNSNPDCSPHLVRLMQSLICHVTRSCIRRGAARARSACIIARSRTQT